jgi:DNA-binding XRE family transcriptional regulator
MSIMAKVSEWKRCEDRRHDVLSALAAITRLAPNEVEDLITYLKALNEASTASDQEEQEYLVNAILEVFGLDTEEHAAEIQDWDREVRSSAAGQAAAKELHAETERFFSAYHRLKARSGLTTIRKIAEAASISPTTVQAIEKQRVKPQCKTVQALAKAFGVDPVALNDGTA